MLLPLASEGAWIVNSQFQLRLNEGLFDKLIEDFWQSLQGEQQIDIGSFTVTPGGIPIRIEGVSAKVNYAFSLPQRVDERTREWEIHSENLGATLHIDKISATQIVEREVDGIIIRVRLQADCNNVTLKLPQGLTQVSARIRAEVAQNQVKLSLPAYDASWAQGAWQVESMQCTGVEGFDQIVKGEALKALSSFQNFDAEVHEALTRNFAQWSKDASLLLLSEQELPSGKDYLKVYYRPQTAAESENGLLLTGDLRFEYPYVSPDQTIEQSYTLKQGELQATANPELLLPFDTVRALMMGEYFAGQLEYSLYSTEIPAFTDFMQSRWQQFWAFPELQSYPKDTKFAFQFLPLGPPSLQNEKAGGSNTVNADLTLPLSVRMFAPLDGKLRPMVEFRTYISGPSSLKILPNGKIEFHLSTQAYPVTYAWAQSYVSKYSPTQRIAIDTISGKVRSALSSEGFTLAIPSFTVGRQLQLVPQGWNLVGGNIRLDFTAK
jgi:hypothetical protein